MVDFANGSVTAQGLSITTNLNFQNSGRGLDTKNYSSLNFSSSSSTTPTDTNTDIIWRNSATGENVVWSMNGTNLSSGKDILAVADQNWKVVGTGDFNNDGNTDILWRNSATGKDVVWFMKGNTLSSTQDIFAVPDQNWKVVGTGDFNKDSNTDILWRNSATGEDVVWFMNGTTISSTQDIFAVPNQNWNIVGTGDFNKDGNTDILWRNSATGEDVEWFMNGTTISSTQNILAVPDANWKIVGNGDFNNDGNTDILWRNSATGEDVVWFMNGTTISSTQDILAVPDQNWKVVGTGDFNADSNTDILWRNSATGEDVVWFMNGTTISSTQHIQPAISDTNWQIVGTGNFHQVSPVSVGWTQQLGTSGNDYSRSVATDSNGNVYITGDTTGSLGGVNQGGTDGWLAKYNTAGTLQWKTQLGTSGNDYSRSVAIDSNGNVYITGDTNGSLAGVNQGGYDAWVAKYDSSGNQQWKTQLGSSSDDFSYGVTTDSNGNVYITGSTTGSLGGANQGGTDAWVAKYNSVGNQQWKTQLGSSGNDISRSIAIDSNGNVYISGDTDGSLGGVNQGATDAWVAKYTNSGSLQWDKPLGTSGFDASNSVATDSNGNVYITGYTHGSLGGVNQGGYDAWVAKYDSSGAQLWQSQLGTPVDENSSGIAIDSNGNVYISGSTYGSLGGANQGGEDAWAAKYNSVGTQLWETQLGSSGNDYSSGVAIDSNGNVYVSGYTDGSFGGPNQGAADAWVAKLIQS